MRRGLVTCALAITLVGCRGPSTRAAELTIEPTVEDNTEAAPFVHRAGFEPTAFSVRVVGTGRPVIFIPGLGCPGAIWDDTVARLDAAAASGIEAHVLTLAGFAGTDPIAPPLAARTRKDLVRYIRSRQLERPIVIGHSMGGFIAYWLAATAPGLIGGLVVVDAGPELAAADEADARRLRNAWAQAGDDEVRVRVRNVFSSMTRKPEKLAPYFKAIASSDLQTIGDSIYELVTTSVRDKLGAITAPALIVLADGGFQSKYRQMVKAIPEHEVVVLPRTRHFVMFDDPQGFTRVVGKFLASLDEE
jgi:N-formylmaleamate deformylase